MHPLQPVRFSATPFALSAPLQGNTQPASPRFGQDAFKAGSRHELTLPVRGENLRVSWQEYGNPNAQQVIICAHGLSRNSRDFDTLAKFLATSGDYRVICPDVVGRGDSQWFQQDKKPRLTQLGEISKTNLKYYFKHLGAYLKNPLQYPQAFERLAADYRWETANNLNRSKYNFNTYTEQLNALLAHPALKLAGKDITWLGTSMGGLLGIRLAGQEDSPIRRLILNDVGPEFHAEGLRELAQMAQGNAQATYPSLEAVREDFKKRFTGYGPMSEAQWTELARASTDESPQDGLYRLRFDPRLLDDLRRYQKLEKHLPGPARQLLERWMDLGTPALSSMVNLWQDWRQVQGPVLILRGEHSQILPRKTLHKMLRSHPQATAVEIPETAHAPSLLQTEQLQRIRDWLQRT